MARPGLRIKLLRRGRVVSDTPVTGGTVYSGHHWRCQIVDPHSRPARRKLLTAGWSGYVIHLPPDATGSFTLAGSTLSLEAMVSWGLARKGRKGYRVPIRGDMTAQIETEGSSLLLETVAIAEPERVLQPQSHGRVPVKYRLLMPDRTDMTFFLLLTLVFLLYVMAVRGLLRYPIPDVTTIGELPRRISRLILEPVAPPPSRITRAVEKAAPEAGEAPGVREKAEEAPPPSADEPAKAAGAEPPSSREEIRSRVSRMGVLGVLSGRGTAGRRKASAGISV
ncbi:MAG: hypothetical protein JSV00_07440, partial [bacterium]